jgi:hypothetical protein
MEPRASEESNAEPEEEKGEEEELEGEWELDPNDPTHPDHDLSEDSPYAGWDPAPKPILLRRGVFLLIAVLVIIGLMIPVLVRLTW